ncbi:MAG: hypothetical protein K2G67_06235 [Muribaculaceae bacterium]|nr:hypothetical protein [Muribaculaceae bacterium]
MKRKLLLFCLSALTLATAGAVTVNREGEIRSRKHQKVLNASVKGSRVSNLKNAIAARTPGVIVTPPAGERQMMLGSSMTFYLYYDEVAQDESYGLAYETVFCEDGTVYLKNPISMLDWNTYIKGEVTEDGIEFTLPQLLYSIENDEGYPTVDLMVDVLEYTEIENPNDPDDYYVTFIPSEETRVIKFVKEEDGTYMMEGDYMMGLTWGDEWQGYGEMQLYLEPFSATPVVAPAGLDYDYSYILADELNGWDHTVYRPLGLAYDGDDVYISGMASGMSGAVIKGTFDRQANQLTIPSNQFLGEYYNHFIFMMTGDGYSYYDEDWGETMISFDVMDEPIVLNFDPVKNVFKPVVPEGKENVYFIYNFGNTATYPCEYYAVDRIYSQGPLTDCAPIAPEIIGVSDISIIDPDYSLSLEFMIYGDNKEGQILRDDCIYYNIFINGELYTFTSEEYPSIADEGYESLTDIPVFFNAGDDIFASGNYHGIAFHSDDIETMGVRAVYIDGDQRGESDIVTVDREGNPVDGIKAIVDDSAQRMVEYFDMFGNRVDGIQPGVVVIKRSVNKDGSVDVKKVIGR